MLLSQIGASHLEEVLTTLNDASREHAIALKHLRSAIAIQSSDPEGCYQLAYDAARKGIQAFLMANGLRVTSRGGHYAFVQVAEAGIFSTGAWNGFREMRQVRNLLEYPSSDPVFLTSEETNLAILNAKAMLDEIATRLFE